MKDSIKTLNRFLNGMWNRFITVNSWVRWIFVIAFLWVILFDFWLVNIPAKFSFLSVLGTLTRNLGFAYMTAFIFYFLNVHLPNYKTKVKTFRYINNKIINLQWLSIYLITTLEEAAGVPDSDYKVPSRARIDNLCLKVLSHDGGVFGKFSVPFKNWYELFNLIDIETNRIVKDLLVIKDSLDSEMIRLLTEIDDHAENGLNFSKGIVMGNDTLKFFSYEIYQYRYTCEELVKCLGNNYKFYTQEYFRDQVKSKAEAS